MWDARIVPGGVDTRNGAGFGAWIGCSDQDNGGKPRLTLASHAR